MKHLEILFAAALALALAHPAAAEEPPSVDAVLGAVVAVRAEVPPNARTADSLGLYRDGHGVVIDSDGLVLTIGYLILEAESVVVMTGGGKTAPARILAYDHATGFGLLRALAPLGVRPMALGDSGKTVEGDLVLVAAAGGARYAIQARIVSRRGFTGYWEYMLAEAIFTMPPHPVYGGAALIDAGGRLLGIGSLLVNDAMGPGEHSPGNMFVPIDLLKPILADLVANGRSVEPPRPWLGLYTRELPRGLFVSRVAWDGPAQLAGVLPGSVVLAVGGKPVKSQAEFYRRVWAAGRPGATVRLTLIDPLGEAADIDVITADRYDWLRLEPGE